MSTSEVSVSKRPGATDSPRSPVVTTPACKSTTAASLSSTGSSRVCLLGTRPVRHAQGRLRASLQITLTKVGVASRLRGALAAASGWRRPRRHELFPEDCFGEPPCFCGGSRPRLQSRQPAGDTPATTGDEPPVRLSLSAGSALPDPKEGRAILGEFTGLKTEAYPLIPNPVDPVNPV